MALFDGDTQRVIVRVVYDGPGYAGKTTNLEQLCEFFTSRRRSEMVSPDTAPRERTAFFDWLQLEGGVVGGFPVRCHLFTVPGQRERRARREFLLELADVVVFVCDSTEPGLAEADVIHRELLETISRMGKEVPVVLQANKQDLEGALPPTQVAERLGGEFKATVGSAASSGAGVRETVVLAIREAVTQVQGALLGDGVGSLDTRVAGWEELRARMSGLDEPRADMHAEEKEPEPVPEMEAERVREAEPEGEGEPERDAKAEHEPEPEREVEPEPAPEPAPEPEPEPDLAAAPGPEPEPEASRASQRPVPEEPPPPLTALPVWEQPQRPEASPQEPEEPEEPETPALAASPRRLPRLPRPDVPSSCIWPAAAGRDILREVLDRPRMLRSDLVGRHGSAEGSGAHDVIIYEIDGWCLKTNRRRWNPELDETRTDLVHLARAKVMLGPLVPSPTVLIAQDTDDGAWLWTLCPWVKTLRRSLAEASEGQDMERLGSLLEDFARLAVDAVLLAHREDTILDVHPSNFGYLDGSWVYLDDDLAAGPRVPGIGYSLLQRVEEYGDHPAVVERYVDAILDSVRRGLSAEDVRVTKLNDEIRHVVARTEVARSAQERLVLETRLLESTRGRRE